MNKALKYSLVIFAVLCTLVGVGLIAASLPLKNAEKETFPERTTELSSKEPTETRPVVTEPPVTEPEPAPETEPTPPEPDEATLQAMSIEEGMSLHEKICQLLFVSPDAITGVQNTTVAGDITASALQDYPVGGLIFFSGNLKDRRQVSNMLEGMTRLSALPPFLGVDEEGGRVARVMSNPNLGTTKLDSMYAYRGQGTQTARKNAKTVAADLAGLGFNLDFAPVADVWTNPNNTAIGDRAYSDDYTQAAELIAAAVEGFHEGGVACTLKHFPGHGDTAADSHVALPEITRTVDELRTGEFLPFASGIKAGADLVMMGHLLIKDADASVPASLSNPVVTGLLRRELGFDGVVITDGIGMKALSAYSEGERCLMALNAGCDMLLGVDDVFAVTRYLETAVQNGTLPEERLRESVVRVLRLKIQRGLIPASGN